MRRSIAAMLLVLAAPGFAQLPPDRPQAEGAKQAATEKVVCRREVSIGSNVRGRRVCTTARQRDVMSRSTQNELIRTNGFGGPNNSSQ